MTCLTRLLRGVLMRLLTDSEETGLLDLLVPGFGRLRGAEADRVRRRCVRMIRGRTGVSAALFCRESRGVFPVKLALSVLKAFPEIDREAAMAFYIRRS